MSKPSKLDVLISNLPDKQNKKIVWTLEEDSAILKYAETKGIAAIANAIGKGKSVVHNRYLFLKGKVK